jgi:hypothetical protein
MACLLPVVREWPFGAAGPCPDAPGEAGNGKDDTGFGMRTATAPRGNMHGSASIKSACWRSDDDEVSRTAARLSSASPFCPALASGSCLPRPKLTGRGARLSREGQVVSGRGGGAGDHTTRPLGACPFRAFERGRVSTRVLRLGGFGNAFDVRIGLACHMAIQVGCSDMAWCGCRRKSALPLTWSGCVRRATCCHHCVTKKKDLAN